MTIISAANRVLQHYNMNIKSHQILEDATPGLSRNSSIIADLPITPLVSYYVYTIVMYVLGVSLTSALAMFGVFSNTVNIIVFYKMGFQETTNINFFSLAINDLMASCGNLLVEIFQSPFMKIDELPQGSLILQTTYLASFVVYSCCGFGALITAVLAMERCLCIVFPLKVRIQGSAYDFCHLMMHYKTVSSKSIILLYTFSNIVDLDKGSFCCGGYGFSA